MGAVKKTMNTAWKIEAGRYFIQWGKTRKKKIYFEAEEHNLGD